MILYVIYICPSCQALFTLSVFSIVQFTYLAYEFKCENESQLILFKISGCRMQCTI